MVDREPQAERTQAREQRTEPLLDPRQLGVRELQEDGLVTFDGQVLRVTPLGQLLVRNVAMLFDAYLAKPGKDKSPTFSRTV
jgi:coproporphyrinogen III oxidase-like Fe-S oxidoreductase